MQLQLQAAFDTVIKFWNELNQLLVNDVTTLYP